MAEGGQQSCEKQKTEIGALLKAALKKGETWYLIDTKWFKQWKKYVGFDTWDTSCVGEESAFPGPIDNSPLIKEGTTDKLREHLMDELDYVLVPELAWTKLVTWYSNVPDQQPMGRKVIEQGMFVKHCKVEVYLMDLKLCNNSHIDDVLTHQFSRADTIAEIEMKMRELFEVPENKDVRLWNKYMSNTYEHLSKPENTIQDAGLYQGQVIVIEQKNEDGTWPRQSKMTSSSLGYGSSQSTSSPASSSSTLDSTSSSSRYGSNYYGSNSVDGYRGSTAPGLCGLSNLGNTCFMNSAIQCLSNVPVLTNYFCSELWRSELNVDNPLGMKGEIATTYAELVRTLWTGKYSYTIPRNFKVAVGRFQPQFSGYQQQDSQELMAFLLDGLHEDLNRITKKPYIELQDADNRQDEEVATEQWDNYLKRNDSVITDTFHGLLKSTLVCPACNKISVTFDPFCYLSLPLPIRKNRHIEVIFLPLDPMRKPRQYKLSVPKMGCISDLCKTLAKHTKIGSDKMVVVDVYNHRFHKIFHQDEALNHILDRDDICVYEAPTITESDTIFVPVYLREQRRVNQGYDDYGHTTTHLFGHPTFVAVPKKKCTYDIFYKAALRRMKRFVHEPDDGEEWWKTPAKQKTQSSQTNGEVSGDDHEEDMESDNSEDNSGEESTPNGDNHAPSASTTSSSSSNSLSGGTAPGKNTAKRPPRLFSLSVVNSYGSAEMDVVKDDNKSIPVTSRSYVALTWHARARDQFYDDRAADEIEVDDSVNVQVPNKKQQVVQLTECLDLFTTCEKLGEQDPWYCPRCKKHQQATKKFDLWQLPEVLVVHLKRFSCNRYWRDKLDTFVEYPTKGLNMKKWVIKNNHGPMTYDLIGVSNHYGGMGGGHYTAYCKNKDDGKWYYFDDSSVSAAAEDAVTTKAGYVLVYQRRDCASSSRPASATITSSSDPDPDMVIGNGTSIQNSDDEMDVN